MSRFISVYM